MSMKLSMLVPTVVLGLLLSGGQGQTTTPAAASRPSSAPTTTGALLSDAQIAALIAQLGDANWRVRNAATTKLAQADGSAEAVSKALADADDPEVKARLELVLAGIARRRLARFTELGWAGGSANASDLEGVSYFKILSIAESPPDVVATFAWENGAMSLHAVGRTLTGIWRQDNGSGSIEFTFDAAGKFVSGRWHSDALTGPWCKAFLK
jgi:hypothetical protein